MATKDFSSKQEKMIADKLGWSVVAGSGAAACYPGDVIGDEWLGECKTHTSPGHKIIFKKDIWSKICDEAMIKHRFPVLFTDDGSQKENHTWCLFHASRVDMGRCVLHPLDKIIKVNISLSDEYLHERRNKFIAETPGIIHAFLGIWYDMTPVVIMRLSDFCELFGE